jgi:hypothetical protein
MNENPNAVMIKSTANFSFELEGESEINAETLARILDNTSKLLSGVAHTEPDAYVKLVVKRIGTGSFDIFFSSVVEQAQSLLTNSENLSAALVAAAIEVFGLVKHLKGKRPAKIEQHGAKSKIVNGNDESMSVGNNTFNLFFSNSKFENCVLNIAETVAKENRTGGFSVKSDSDEVVYSKHDLREVGPVVDGMTKEKTNVKSFFTTGEFGIRKPDLIGDSKWGFVADKYIDASFEDKQWLEKMRNEKLSFRAGARLPARLRMDVETDELGDPIPGSEKYTVVEVLGDIIDPAEPEQFEMSEQKYFQADQ